MKSRRHRVDDFIGGMQQIAAIVTAEPAPQSGWVRRQPQPEPKLVGNGLSPAIFFPKFRTVDSPIPMTVVLPSAIFASSLSDVRGSAPALSDRFK
jgi:hypothetical protein